MKKNQNINQTDHNGEANDSALAQSGYPFLEACPREDGRHFQFQPQRGKARFKVRYREGNTSQPNCLFCRD